jgi:hypothetical protein
MYTTNITALKRNPSFALRQAEQEPVLVLKGTEPNALILHLDKELMDAESSLKPALAAILYKNGVFSLGAAAKFSGLAYADFICHLAGLGIDIVQADETVAQERQDVSAWLKPS